MGVTMPPITGNFTLYQPALCICQQRKPQICALLTHGEGTLPVTYSFPSQRSRNTEKLSYRYATIASY